MEELRRLDHWYMVVPRRHRWTLGSQALKRPPLLQEMRGQAEIQLLGPVLANGQHHWHLRHLEAGTRRSRGDHAMLPAEASAKDSSRTLPVHDAKVQSHRSP